MPNIKPWYWPPKYTCDRVVYVPTRPANLFEYQEELIDAEGNVYWKTVDTTTASGSSSMKEFLSLGSITERITASVVRQK